MTTDEAETWATFCSMDCIVHQLQLLRTCFILHKPERRHILGPRQVVTPPTKVIVVHYLTVISRSHNWALFAIVTCNSHVYLLSSLIRLDVGIFETT